MLPTSKARIKLFTLAAGAALSGSYFLFNKLSGRNKTSCPFCASKDVYTLNSPDGAPLAYSCGHCSTRWRWEPTGAAVLDDERWDELLERTLG